MNLDTWVWVEGGPASVSITASWTSSLDPTRTALADQDVPSTAEIPVVEVQSIGT